MKKRDITYYQGTIDAGFGPAARGFATSLNLKLIKLLLMPFRDPVKDPCGIRACAPTHGSGISRWG